MHTKMCVIIEYYDQNVVFNLINVRVCRTHTDNGSLTIEHRNTNGINYDG